MRIVSIDPKHGEVVIDIDGLELTIKEKEGELEVSQLNVPPSRREWLTKSLISIACRKAAEVLAEARVKQLSFKF